MVVDWSSVAPLMADIFGTEYDENEKYFQCPDCEEPIYECDYPEIELLDETAVMCPICGTVHEIF